MSDQDRSEDYFFEDYGLGGQDTGGPGERRGVGGEFSDRELVTYIGLFGAVAVEHVMWRFGVGRSAAYGRVARCVEAGLLDRVALLREEPALLRATAVGLRYAGLDGYPVARVSAGSALHLLRCASIAAGIGEGLGWDRIVTEREIRHAEREEGRPLFSAKVGENPDGSPRLHRPDLGVIGPEFPIAVEVELSAKSPKRLAEIMRGWRRASWVGEVTYLCEPGHVYRAVSRAAKKAHASERVRVLPLSEAPREEER
jgi:hypothetical protein